MYLHTLGICSCTGFLHGNTHSTSGAQTIIAIDVAAVDNTNYTNYGDSLSGWWTLWKKLPLPSSLIGQPVLVPTMGDISGRLAYLTCEMHGRRVKRELIDIYVQPKVTHIGMLQFQPETTQYCVQAGYDAIVMQFPEQWEPRQHAS